MVAKDSPAFFIRAWTTQLYDEFQHLCYTYRLGLKRPVIRIEDLGSRWGLWDPETRTLSLSLNLIEKYPWEFVIEILKHEMAHQIVNELYGVQDSHGKEFQRACEALGVAGWAARASAAEMPIPSVSQPAVDSEEGRLLDRVEKLLRLAQSENEHEALLAMQRVQEIYAKYNLQSRVLSRPSDWTYAVIKLNRKRVERYQSRIATILNEHFFVEVVHSRLYDAEKLTEFKTLELLGTRENVAMAEYVYHFLVNQLGMLWRGYQKGRKLKLTAKNSFYLGALTGFQEKLKAAEQEYDSKEQKAGRPSLFLVLKKDPATEAYLNYRYPRLHKLGGGRRMHDSTAFQAGQAQGRNLTLKKGIDQKPSFLGRLLKP